MNSRPSARVLVAVGLVVALLLAGLISGFASSSPDGLEAVAGEKGFADTAGPHATDGSPLAEYALGGDDSRLGTGVAGILGVGITFAVGAALFSVVRRRRADDHQP